MNHVTTFSDLLVSFGILVLKSLNAAFTKDLGLLGVLAALYAALTAWIVWYRDTLRGKMLLYSNRKLALHLSARFWGPTGFSAAGVAAAFVLAAWLPGAAGFRPEWWPASVPYWLVVACIGAMLLQSYLWLANGWLSRWLGPIEAHAAYPLVGAAGGALAGWLMPAPWYPAQFVLPMRGALIALAFTPLPVLVGLHTLWRRLGREKIIDHVQGSAGFAARSEIAENRDAIITLPIKVSHVGSAQPWKEKASGPLGHAVMQFSQDCMWTHVLLDGNTGSGKGMGIFGPITFSLIAGDGAGFSYKFILQDVKGVTQGKDLYEARLGRQCITWGCAAAGQFPSMRWNPVREALDSDDPIGECLALAAILMPDHGSANDFIPQAGRPLLASCLASGIYPTLADLFDDVQQRGLVQVCIANDCAPGDILLLTGKNMAEWVQGEFKACLGAYADGGWGELVTGGHDFGLDDFLEVGGYVLSAEAIKDRKAPLRLMWQMLFRRLQTQRKRRDLLLLFDEALAAGPIPGARDGLVILREDRVSIWYGVQHLDGLKEVYGPQEGESLISSFGSKIYLMHGLSDNDKNTLAQSLGQRTTMTKAKRNGHTEEVLNHGPLLPVNAMGGLARGEKEFWAVFDVISQTKPNSQTHLGLPVLAKVVPTTPFLQRRPTQEEVEAVTSKYNEHVAFTPPALTREAVEKVVRITGKKELLKLVKDQEEPGADLLSLVPSDVDFEGAPEREVQVANKNDDLSLAM